ncbi:Histone-lysine N-methyltransferase SMYD3 [Trichinella pseudospiralis]|uniref:Histone-lysine N-methyltransferase SMYD3 n=1 Tax=Trichinella pseudospiralis TaxID=6337 RepID=A0A0V1JR50_TRIPS|nr:Histone-lysine N-methyltransferase SMYD3 [Trichinella pseudospiralis]
MCNVYLMPEVAEEWPWAYVISQNIDSSSHYCCSKYCGVLYCDENCHNQAISDHRYECKVLLHSKGDIPSDSIRLMVRIIGKLNDHSNTSDFSCKASYENRKYHNLMSHKDEIFKDEKRTSEFSRCCYFLKCIIEPNELPETTILMEMFGKILINSFVILDNELNSAGLGLYLNLSKLNHSCNPSCVVTFDGPKAYLNTLNSEFEVTTSTILENLTISYVALIDDTAHRRKALRERYYFICKCERCSDARLDSIATALVCDNGNCDGVAIIDVAEETARCEKCATVIDDIWEAESLMTYSAEKNDYYYKRTEELLAKQQKWLHPLNVYRIRTVTFVGHAAYESGRTERTLFVYEELISKYEFYLAEFHPLIAVNFMTIGKLYMLRNMYTTALSFLEKSLNVMKYSHGEKHSLYVHLLSMIEKCQLQINVHDNDWIFVYQAYHVTSGGGINYFTNHILLELLFSFVKVKFSFIASIVSHKTDSSLVLINGCAFNLGKIYHLSRSNVQFDQANEFVMNKLPLTHAGRCAVNKTLLIFIFNFAFCYCCSCSFVTKIFFFSKSKMNMHTTFIAFLIFSMIVVFDVAYANTEHTAKGASNRGTVNVKPRAHAKRAAATSRHSPESHEERRG